MPSVFVWPELYLLNPLYRLPAEGGSKIHPVTMTKDQLHLVGTGVTILTVLVAAILFPLFRSVAFWLLVSAACWLLLLVVVGMILLVKFSRAVGGQKSFSETRCPQCRKRRAMRETSREFLHGNVKFNIDHHRVLYRCAACGYEEEQEELVDPKR